MLLLSLLFWGCTQAAPELEGAIHKDKIPVYPNSQADPQQALAGSESESTYSKYWDLKTQDPPEKVVEFYKKAMPQAKVESAEGATTLTWKFPGAEEGEYLEIRVEKGKVHTVECLLLGKHKR